MAGAPTTMAIAAVLGAGPAWATPGTAPVAARRVNAEPHVIGANLGVAQSAIEAEQGIEARGTIGLFVRRGFSHRWALHFDVARVRHDERWDVHTSTASVLRAFPWKPWLVPTVRAGLGFDVATAGDDSTMHAVHAETAAGLELRFDGFVLGAELGIGWRGPQAPVCLAESYDDDNPGVEIGGCDEPLYHTSYRAAKLTLGIAF